MEHGWSVGSRGRVESGEIVTRRMMRGSWPTGGDFRFEVSTDSNGGKKLDDKGRARVAAYLVLERKEDEENKGRVKVKESGFYLTASRDNGAIHRFRFRCYLTVNWIGKEEARNETGAKSILQPKVFTRRCTRRLIWHGFIRTRRDRFVERTKACFETRLAKR